MIIENVLSRGPSSGHQRLERQLKEAIERRLKNHDVPDQSESHQEDLRNSLTGITRELLTTILFNPALKLEKTITCYESQHVLPLTMEHSKYKIGTLGMEVKLSLQLRTVQMPSSEETSVTKPDSCQLSLDFGTSSSKPEQTESNTQPYCDGSLGPLMLKN